MLRIQVLCPLARIGDDLLPDGGLGIIGIFLFEKSYPDVFQEDDLSPGIGAVSPCKDAEQTGLSGSVGSDQGNLVALVDVEADVLEKDFRALGL